LRKLFIKFKYSLYRILKQRNKYISDKNFLIVASIIIGLVSSAAAIMLKVFVHFLEDVLINIENYEYSFLNLFYPLIGISLSVIFIKYALNNIRYEKGLGSIIHSIAQRQSSLKKHKTFSHLITSALTVGFGGSVGLEAPIAVTGSAIGSNIARQLFLSKKEKTLLLASGAAAGISAIFNSPLAGVIFAFEVILQQVSVPAFIPLLIASATASVVLNIFYQGQLITYIPTAWDFHAIPEYLILALTCGLLSAYTIRVTHKIESRFANKDNNIFKAASGGLLLGIFIFFIPMLYGEGYSLINIILSGRFDSIIAHNPFSPDYGTTAMLFIVLASAILLKPFAAAITISAGGNGGIFAPSMFMGALNGLLVARIINLSGFTNLNELNFVVVSMAGMLSGVLSAPLSAIFLIAEVTGGYSLFVPLMIVSAMSFFIARYFEPNSIYTKRLVEQGLLETDTEKKLLQNFSVVSVLEDDFMVLHPHETLGAFTKCVVESKRNVFPVCMPDGSFVGTVLLDNAKEILFKHELYEKIRVSDLMTISNDFLDKEDSLEMAMEKFELKQDLWNLPVLDGEKYCGFVSKTGVLNKIRDALREEEKQRS